MPDFADFLTPQEVAEALKISTYTAYEIIKRGELSAVRVGRQLRVPREEFERYADVGAREGQQGASTGRPKAGSHTVTPLVIAGSHDPALEILVSHTRKTHPELQVATTYTGSLEGLVALFQKRAHVVAAHLWDADDASREAYLQHILPNQRVTVVRLCLRNMGLATAAGNPEDVTTLGDIVQKGLRFINRQRGAGTRVRFDRMLSAEGIDSEHVVGYEDELDTHHAVAMAIGAGEADVGMVCETAARASGLHFISLYQEPYDLVFETDTEERPELQALLKVIRSESFQARLLGLRGYDLAQTGRISRINA